MAVKCVLAKMYRAAGARVEMEQHTDARPDRRPADLLVSGVFPKPCAIDPTVWSRRGDGPDPVDAVVQCKVAAGKRAEPREVRRIWKGGQ